MWNASSSLEEPPDVVPAAGLPHLLRQLVHLGERQGQAVGQDLADDLGLERKPHDHVAVDLRHADEADEDAPLGDGHHETFEPEAVQRLSERGAAHPELGGLLALVEHGTRRQLARRDRSDEGRVGPLALARAGRGFARVGPGEDRPNLLGRGRGPGPIV